MKNLKKISSGFLALVFGITLVVTQSAFKTPTAAKSGKRIPVTVYYHGPDFSQANVTTESNWNTTPNTGGCDSEPEVACSVTIDSDYLSGSTLRTEADLQALESTSSRYYISGSDDPSAVYVNKTF
ncbi:hypothetical protein [Pedobacter sp. R-06]|uniref:hypothetical protein n=1 Tax=Pedobacter sp. R-06 TaxID=3404051 RepID=UPI003CF48391